MDSVVGLQRVVVHVVSATFSRVDSVCSKVAAAAVTGKYKSVLDQRSQAFSIAFKPQALPEYVVVPLKSIMLKRLEHGGR